MISCCQQGVRIAVVLLGLVSLAGCGGLSVNPAKDTDKKGYTVYAPMVLVNVSITRTCKEPGSNGACDKGEYFESCTVSAPYVLPDYDKAFTVKFQKGLGSYSGTATIVNGWMLGSATSAGDPSDFLTNVGELGIKMNDQLTCKEGVYRLGTDGKFTEFNDLPWRK